MMFILGIIVGVLLSAIALYGATRLAKPINNLFTVNASSGVSSTLDTHKQAQVIKRELPTDKFLKNE